MKSISNQSLLMIGILIYALFSYFKGRTGSDASANTVAGFRLPSVSIPTVKLGTPSAMMGGFLGVPKTLTTSQVSVKLGAFNNGAGSTKMGALTM